MKLTLATLFVFVSSVAAFSQTSIYRSEVLDVNNWDVRFNSSGAHGWQKIDAEHAVSHIYFPKGDSSSPIFGFTPWIAAQDSSGNYYVSAQTYLHGNQTDWTAGPVVKDTLPLTDSSRLEYWNKLFKLNQWEQNQQKNNSRISESIRNWPVFGHNLYEEPERLAPFNDDDKNGTYDPDFGDSPEIKGHQMLWMVQNDAGEKLKTRSRNMAIECRTSGFAFSCSDNPLLNNVFFVEYELINRSPRQYHNLLIGQWTDFDLGYGYDDLIGSDSANGCFFVYNGDSIDEGPKGYGTNHPIVSVTPLSADLLGFMWWFSDFTIYGNPRTPKDYHDRLNSLWKTGAPLHERWFGARRGRVTKFMYGGNLLDTAEWSELSDGSQPAERMGMGSTGPFTLSPSDTIKSLWAFTFHRAPSGKTVDAYKLMLKEVPELKKLYAQTSLVNPCTSAIGTNVQEVEESSISLYPNPAVGQVKIKSVSPIRSVRVLSIDGRVLRVIQLKRNTVDISNLQPGLYLLEFLTPSGKSIHRLVVE